MGGTWRPAVHGQVAKSVMVPARFRFPRKKKAPDDAGAFSHFKYGERLVLRDHRATEPIVDADAQDIVQEVS